GPDEHGAFDRSASPISRPPHRGVCRHAAAATQNTRLETKGSAEAFDAKQAAAIGTAAEEDGLRFSGARVAARPTAPVAGRYAGLGCGGTLAAFPARGDSNSDAQSLREACECRVSSVGVDDPVPMDEE